MKKSLRPLSIGLVAAIAMGVSSCDAGGNADATNNQCAALSDSAAVINTIMERRSIRAYKDIPVEKSKLELLAQCGINAPSGLNKQPWEVRIVDNPEYINGVTEVFKKANPEQAAKPEFKNMFRNAPALIFVGAPSDGSGNLDCGLLGENIVLAAKAIGLGTCIQAGPTAFMKNTPECAGYIEQLELPADYEVLYVIGVGYPDETPAAKPRNSGKVKFVGGAQ